MVNEKRIRSTFEELVRIYTPSKGEREICDLLKKKLKALGASKITEDNGGSVAGGNAGNLIATFSANAEASFGGADRSYGFGGMLPRNRGCFGKRSLSLKGRYDSGK